MMTARVLPPLVTPLSLVEVVGAPLTDEPPVVIFFRPSVTPQPLLGFGSPLGVVAPASALAPASVPPIVVLPPLAPPVPTFPPVPVPPVLVVSPPLAPAVLEPPAFDFPPPVAVLEPPVLVFPPLLADELETPPLPPAAEELPPLLAGDELPPVAELLELLDFPPDPPWLELGLELPPVAPALSPESLEHDTTSAGRPTHKVAKSSFFIEEPPNRELRTGDERPSGSRGFRVGIPTQITCRSVSTSVKKFTTVAHINASCLFSIPTRHRDK